MSDIYSLGDYVNYQGGIAEIIRIEIGSDKVEEIPFVNYNNEVKKTSFNNISHIETKEKHLLEIGFAIRRNKKNPFYVKGNITIGSILIKYKDPQSQLGFGFIPARMRAKQGAFNNAEILKAIGSNYDETAFSQIFEPVETLNKLFIFLENNGIKFDKETVSRL